MTPQLQQAIRLLQLSTLDLQQEIQQALESNPLLEVSEEEEAETRPEQQDTAQASDGPMQSLEQAATDAGGDNTEWDSDAAQMTLPDELPVDTQWEDLLPSASAPPPQGDDASDMDFDSRTTASESLREKLLWQLSLTRLSDTDRLIALTIIDDTDDNGRLIMSLEDIHLALSADLEIDLDEVVAVLHRVQQFEPAGVCTRDLQECLLVQLQQLPPSTPWLEQAKLILSRHINQLGSGDYKQILRRTRLTEPELKEVLAQYKHWIPIPGKPRCRTRSNMWYRMYLSARKTGDGGWSSTLISPRNYVLTAATPASSKGRTTALTTLFCVTTCRRRAGS